MDLNKLDQGIALVLYRFAFYIYRLEIYAGRYFYVLWSGIGVIATAALAKVFLGQHIDLAGWIGIRFYYGLGLMIIAHIQILMFRTSSKII